MVNSVKTSAEGLQNRETLVQPPRKVRELSGQHQQAHGPQKKPHDALDRFHMATHPAHHAGQAWEKRGHQKERHAKAKGVEAQKCGAARNALFGGRK